MRTHSGHILLQAFLSAAALLFGQMVPAPETFVHFQLGKALVEKARYVRFKALRDGEGVMFTDEIIIN